MAGTFERVLGRPVPVNCVPLGQPVPGVFEYVVPVLAGFDMYDSPMDMSEIAPRYGVALTAVEEFARQMAAQG